MKWIRKNDVWTDYHSGKPVETFPIQISYTDLQRRKTEVPLEIAREAHKEYSAQFGTSQSLERLGERGGFGVGELAFLLYDRIKRLELASET